MTSPALTQLAPRAAPIVSELGIPYCIKQCPDALNTLMGTNCDDWCFCSKFAYSTTFWKSLEACANTSCKDSTQHTIALRFIQSQGEAIQANCEFRGLKDAGAHAGITTNHPTSTTPGQHPTTTGNGFNLLPTTTKFGVGPTDAWGSPTSTSLWNMPTNSIWPAIPSSHTGNHRGKISAAPSTRPSGGFLLKVVGSLVVGLAVAGVLPGL